MQSKPLLAGDPIEARCTKCRKNTDHLIITIDDESPVKVQCKTCNRQHKYRPPTQPKKPGVRLALQNKEAERKEWELLRPKMNSSNASDYSMTAPYKIKALINHPLFGLGQVQRVLGSQKVAVLFEDGLKTMRCK